MIRLIHSKSAAIVRVTKNKVDALLSLNNGFKAFNTYGRDVKQCREVANPSNGVLKRPLASIMFRKNKKPTKPHNISTLNKAIKIEIE
jgi:hypothetical protein